MKCKKALPWLCLLMLVLFTLPSAVSTFDFTVPDTGQTLCYDWTALMANCPVEGEDFYGQDGNYLINPPSLTDNGNGTVTDTITGLTWEQKTQAGEQLFYSYADAIAYCETLALGGITDWRIPTRKELILLMNFGRVSPSLDVTYFPYYTSGGGYWTTSEYYDDPSKVWVISMAFGLTYTYSPISETFQVRCVSGRADPASVFYDNTDGTVTDMTTGLMWEQKTDDGGPRDKDTKYTWRDALAYCTDLILAGFSDWRVPTPKEIERLVDLDSSSPAIDTGYFPNTNSGLYWTGTTCSGCHKRKAFAVDFTDGNLFYSNKEHPAGVYHEQYVRCVRNAAPTLIELSALTARPKNKAIVIEWTTETEIHNAGFNIYRSEAKAGEYIRVNDALISPQGSPSEGAVYAFVDTNIEGRKTYYYKLEDVDLNGTTTMHGPVSAALRLFFRILNQ